MMEEGPGKRRGVDRARVPHTPSKGLYDDLVGLQHAGLGLAERMPRPLLQGLKLNIKLFLNPVKERFKVLKPPFPIWDKGLTRGWL